MSTIENNMELIGKKIYSLFCDYSGFVIYNKALDSKKCLKNIFIGFEVFPKNNQYVDKVSISVEVTKNKKGDIVITFFQDFLVIFQTISLNFLKERINYELENIIKCGVVHNYYNNLIINNNQGIKVGLISQISDMKTNTKVTKYAVSKSKHRLIVIEDSYDFTFKIIYSNTEKTFTDKIDFLNYLKFELKLI